MRRFERQDDKCRRARAAPIHLPTFEWQVGRLGKTLEELADATRYGRHPVSKRTLQRAWRGHALDWRSRVAIAEVLELTLAELEHGAPFSRGVHFTPTAAFTEPDDDLYRAVGPSFERDARQMFLASNALDLRNVERSLGRLSPAPRFERFHDQLAQSAVLLADSSAARPCPAAADPDAPTLRIRCPQTLLTSLLLFEYLIRYEHLRAELELDLPHSAKALFVHLEQECDDELVVLPLSAAVLYYRRNRTPLYVPLALLPRGSHRLVDLGRARSSASELVLLPGEATAPAYFENLRRYHLLGPEAQGVPCDPDLSEVFETDATSAVFWFPQNVLYHALHGGRYLDRGDLEIASMESVLLAREDLLERNDLVQDLTLLLNKAHVALTANPDLIPLLVRSLFSQPDYRSALLSEAEHAASLDR